MRTTAALLAPKDGQAARARPVRLIDRLDPASIRRQESAVILLNLAVLAGIAAVHVLFAPTLGTPPRWFFVALVARFVMQTVELVWLASGRPEGTILGVYAHTSIWLNVLFAFALSQLGGMEDSHYVVLMVIPVIAAAFRYRAAGVTLVLAAAVTLTFLEIWVYFRGRPVANPIEYFEAANVALIYLVVAAVVALLARQLRAEQEAVRASLQELESTRDRLVKEEKLAAVGRLASAIAHEIRNPVGMIVSSLALFREGGMARDEACTIVDVEASRLERLTTDFLAYARQRPPERKRAAVSEILGYVAGLVRGRGAATGVEIRVRCVEEIDAHVDAFQMHQALLNLALNAVEASLPGGKVTLEGRRESPRTLVLAVENDGPPLAHEVATRIFEPFFTTKPTGTGLGLAITRSIASAHGGTAMLEANESQRVRFSIRLPGACADGEGTWHAS